MKTKILFNLLVAICLIPVSGLPCSVVSVSDSSKTTTGYTMDWVSQISLDPNKKYLGGGIFTLDSGVMKQSLFAKHSQTQQPGQTNFTWESKYRSLVFSTLGPAFPMSGVNEMGLEIYTLGPPSLMRDGRSSLPKITEADILTILLDTTKDIEEVKQALNTFRIEQYLLPIHYYIKDRSGKVIVVDFKSGLRIHDALPFEAFVTNDWYDVEQNKWKNNISDPNDNRYFYIGKNTKRPDDVESVITYVGTNNRTMWQSFSTVENEKWIYKLRVNTAKVSNPNLTKDVIIDLAQLFSQKSYPHNSKAQLFSDLLRSPVVSFKDVDDEELRLIQKANLKSLLSWESQLFSRNEEHTQETLDNYHNLLKSVDSEPFDNVIK